MCRSNSKLFRFITLFLFLIVTLSLPVKADSGYTIESYDVDMTVNEDNSFHITETIVADFTGANKHGIIRSLPLRNTVRRLDGSVSNNHATVKNVTVNEEYKTYKEDGNYCIRIGSSDKTVKGQVTYVISYDYNIGKDTLKNADELYYNIIGGEWDTEISNITFRIHMPKSFDVSKLGFSSGRYGSSSTDPSFVYTVNGNDISGSLAHLSSYESLTVRMEMEEGYFVYHRTALDYLAMLFVCCPFVSLIYVFMQWYQYGRDDKVVETLEFYPPEGLNPLDLKLYYAGSITSSDVTALLPYLAGKGYLEIYDRTDRLNEEKGVLGRLFNNRKYDFEIVKTADYDGSNKEERMFFNGLFSRYTHVEFEDLYDSFYKTTERIVNSVNKRKNKVFENMENQTQAYILGAISFVILLLIPAVKNGAFHMIVAIMMVLLGAFFLTYFFRTSVGGTLLSLLLGLPMAAFGSVMTYFVMKEYINPVALIVGIASLFITYILARLMPKRGVKSNRLYGQILGFKNFLEKAQKEQLEELVETDPSYFYDILPYTYVLGISDKWISKFDAINLKAPDYYHGDYYDHYYFDHFMHDSMHHMNDREVDTSDSGGSSGGSSGGGFSGGGSGGGGGSSW